MSNPHFILFETAIGCCGIAWNGAGILAVTFPEGDEEKTRARLRRRVKDAREAASPPCEIARVIEDIAALFKGEKRDLSYADLDMTGVPEFDREVYGLALEIKPGETKTYGELAQALGDITLARNVGQALGRNPFPIIVPCHRVVGAEGRMTGFSAPGGIDSKRRLLKIEGALAPDLFDIAG